MNMIKGYLGKIAFDKISALILLAFLVFCFRGMINILLLTFVLSFFLYTIQNFIFVNLRKVIKIERTFVAVGVFIIIFLIIVLMLYKYIPIIIDQFSTIIKQVGDFNIDNMTGKIDERIVNAIKEVDIESYVKSASNTALKALTNIGKWGVDLFIACILSLFFVLEKEEVVKFGRRMDNSRLAGAFGMIKYFGRSFINSFAKVMQAQLIISTVNTAISMIALSIMRFPQVLGLGFMIFILGLIPVVGMWVSLVPLTIIAFKIGGVMKVIYVWALILFVHCLEAYVLNPKIMSMNTKVPVFMTFLVLLASEHLMGVWGLLFGIPIFMFLLDIFNIKETELAVDDDSKTEDSEK